MYVHAKTIMTSYGKLAKLAKEADGMIERAALASFCSHLPVDAQIDRVCELIERKNLLVNLYVITKSALKKLDADDLTVLKAKYLNGKELPYCSKRTYFRRLSGAVERLSAHLKEGGITKESFEGYAQKISFLAVTRDLIAEKERATRKRASTLRLNKTFNKGLKSKQG